MMMMIISPFLLFLITPPFLKSVTVCAPLFNSNPFPPPTSSSSFPSFSSDTFAWLCSHCLPAWRATWKLKWYFSLAHSQCDTFSSVCCVVLHLQHRSSRFWRLSRRRRRRLFCAVCVSCKKNPSASITTTTSTMLPSPYFSSHFFFEEHYTVGDTLFSALLLLIEHISFFFHQLTGKWVKKKELPSAGEKLQKFGGDMTNDPLFSGWQGQKLSSLPWDFCCCCFCRCFGWGSADRVTLMLQRWIWRYWFSLLLFHSHCGGDCGHPVSWLCLIDARARKSSSSSSSENDGRRRLLGIFSCCLSSAKICYCYSQKAAFSFSYWFWF